MNLNFLKQCYLILAFIGLTGCQLVPNQEHKEKPMKSNIDVLIIGGSHAGLSAAMALGRLRRSALIVDAGKPRNEVSEHANNIAGFDGVDPDKLRKQAKNDLKKYKTIEFINGKVIKVLKIKDIFIATLDSGVVVEARKVILAYGVKDKMLDIEGIEKEWGKSVFHCPYCHGHEYKDKRIGFIGNGQFAEHIVPMLFSLSKDITIFTMGPAEFSDEFKEKLKNNRIKFYSEPVVSFAKSNDILSGLVLKNKELVAIDATFAGPILPMATNSSIAEELGCEKNEMGFITVDKMGMTSVEGVFAAGDIMTMQQSVVGAMATGQVAGSAIVSILVNEDF